MFITTIIRPLGILETGMPPIVEGEVMVPKASLLFHGSPFLFDQRLMSAVLIACFCFLQCKPESDAATVGFLW
jgi:hypothetical protein